MAEYLPKDELEPKRDPKKPSLTRIAIWLVVAAIGAYYLVSGIVGIAAG